MSEKLSISKITDKEEILDVQGQGCTDDCIHYRANASSAPGCGYYSDCISTCIL